MAFQTAELSNKQRQPHARGGKAHLTVLAWGWKWRLRSASSGGGRRASRAPWRKFREGRAPMVVIISLGPLESRARARASGVVWGGGVRPRGEVEPIDVMKMWRPGPVGTRASEGAWGGG